MAKNKNLKKTFEAGALTKRHSEDEVRRIPYLFLKRFFAEYKFPFAGNCLKPAQNDGKNLTPFSPLSLPSPSRGEGHKTVKNLFTHSPIHLFTPKKQAAFTLTEVLVALSIVGIIAALVLPAVITNYQNKSFNQAFQRETQALQSTIEGLPVSENKANFFDTMMYKTSMETDETTGAANYDDSSKAFMQKYLKVSKFCGTNTDCFAEKYYEYTDGDKKVYTPDFKGACAKLKNGMSICLTPQVGTTPIEGVIDLNGAKGPNVFGKDLRTFMISAFVKNGRNTTTDTVLSYDFDPIVPEEEETDPCEGKTCGCGSLPDCPTCETTPESSWSEECCLANTSKITPGHHCCSFSQFSGSSYCKKQCSSIPNNWDLTCCNENASSVTSSTHHCCSFSSFKSNHSGCYEENKNAVAKASCSFYGEYTTKISNNCSMSVFNAACNTDVDNSSVSDYIFYYNVHYFSDLEVNNCSTGTGTPYESTSQSETFNDIVELYYNIDVESSSTGKKCTIYMTGNFQNGISGSCELK